MTKLTMLDIYRQTPRIASGGQMTRKISPRGKALIIAMVGSLTLGAMAGDAGALVRSPQSQIARAIPEQIAKLIDATPGWRAVAHPVIEGRAITATAAMGVTYLDFAKNSDGSFVSVLRTDSWHYFVVVTSVTGMRDVTSLTGSADIVGHIALPPTPPSRNARADSDICGDTGIAIAAGFAVCTLAGGGLVCGPLGTGFAIFTGVACLIGFADVAPLQAQTSCMPDYCQIDTRRSLYSSAVSFTTVKNGQVNHLKISSVGAPWFKWYSLRSNRNLETLYMYGTRLIDNFNGTYDVEGSFDVPSAARYVTDCMSMHVLVTVVFEFADGTLFIDNFGISGGGSDIFGSTCQNG
jgi:hypothetical protein